MFLNLFQRGTETDGLSKMPDREDSGEETSQEDPPVTSWNELSIIDRVGFNSAEMSEKDLEAAFAQITLAFRSDQYTLKQRLQAEEHARNLAEENIELELTRGRETLEILKGLCLDPERSKILQKLQLSLDILSWTVERISNTAEVLGAVHQEARVSRAVELMVAHVENLQRRLDRTVSALEDAKKPTFTNPAASADQEQENQTNCCNRKTIRRRVSILIMSSPTQGNKKKEPPSPPPNPESSSLKEETSTKALIRQRCRCCRQRPLIHWLYHHCWVLLGVYLLVLFAGVTLAFYLWKHNNEELKP